MKRNTSQRHATETCRTRVPNTLQIEKEIFRDYNVVAGAHSLLATFEGGIELDHRGQGAKVAEAMWVAVKGEIHLLLCTSDAKYAKERSSLKSSATPAIAVLTAFLVQQFGVSAGTAATFAAVALLIPLRVTVHAWCRIYDAKMKVTADDKKTLRDLSQGPKKSGRKRGAKPSR